MENLRIGGFERKRRIRLLVNGKEVIAYEGETVFAALIASGRWVFRKTPRLGEGRGPFCGMGTCYDCLVTINGMPNQRSCMIEAEDGMTVQVHEP